MVNRSPPRRHSLTSSGGLLTPIDEDKPFILPPHPTSPSSTSTSSSPRSGRALLELLDSKILELAQEIEKSDLERSPVVVASPLSRRPVLPAKDFPRGLSPTAPRRTQSGSA
ncbi:hypothetical protein HKX48_002299 [Thoreauomyces humboldtii]|nr:hypothetical protein HKX48_002299 [Thoreauomyces humboldtii]